MNERKEMIPAPLRGKHQEMPVFCKPEWDLLCRIRKEIGAITPASHTKAQILVILTNVILDMNDAFDDWPEDPK